MSIGCVMSGESRLSSVPDETFSSVIMKGNGRAPVSMSVVIHLFTGKAFEAGKGRTNRKTEPTARWPEGVTIQKSGCV
jgi:hypothetical protein